MRRFTSFIAMLAMFMVSSLSFAQDTYLEEMKAKTFSVGDRVQEIVPDTWYLIYQNRGGGGYLFDPGVGQRALKGPLDDILAEGNVATEKAKYLVRFIEGESSDKSCTYPTYYLQFGTGHWIADGEDYPSISEDQDGACCWNVGQISEEEKGNFWFNLDYLSWRIDNNDFSGTNATLAYWESGPGTDTGSNYNWYVYSIEFQQGDELEMMKDQVYARLQTLLVEYDAFTPGSEVGQYAPEKVKAFQDALDEVVEIFEDGTYKFTLENLQAMLDKMNAAYDEVKKAQNHLANGYYFLKSAASFYVSTTEGEEEIKTPVQKAIYDNSSGTGWGPFTEETADLSNLFRVDYDESTGYFEFSNVATGGRMPQIWAGTNFTFDSSLSAAESEVELNYFGKDDDGNVEYTVRRADQLNDTWADWEFIYINGYYSGAGTSGTLCGWSAEARGAWVFLPVAEHRVEQLIEDYKAVYEHDALVQRYDSLKTLAEKEMAIAKEMGNLVTDASQYSSPWTEPSEGSIEALLDGDYSSYWHSNWSDGTTDMDKHYLQVALSEPLTYGLKMTFVRRNHGGNQVTDFVLKATNTPSDEGSWDELGNLLFPSTDKGVLLTSDPLLFQGSYQYFRIYPHVTVGDESMAGYWHAAEINFLPAYENPNSQAVKMGKLFTDLEAVLAEQADLTSEQITKEVYDKLQAAVDAFHTMYVDPSILKSAIKLAKTNVSNVVEGTDPGFWSDTAAKTSLQTVIDDAADYDAEANYDPDKSADYVKKLTEGSDNLLSAANKVRTDKWYQIQFPSEEMYDTYGWSKSGADLVSDASLVYAESLYDKVIALGKLVAGDGKSTSRDYLFPYYISVDEAYQGTALVADDKADILDDDLALFRFIEAADGTYMIQNKATGLYVKMTGTSANALADIQPSLFKVSAVGTGANVLKADGLDGADMEYFHIQQAGSMVVSWNASALGSNSSLLITEKGDITDVPGNSFVKAVEEGKIYPMCYAPSFKVTGTGAQLYTVKGINVSGETYSVVLTPTAEAAAGQPVVLVADGEYFEPTDEPLYVDVEMEHGTTFAPQPLKSNCIHGSYVSTSAPAGYIVANGGGFDAVKKSTAVACNSAYLAYENGSVDASAGDLVITVGGNGTVVDSIEETMTQVAASGAVYDVNGRLLLKSGNINSLRQFGKGMYIVNGVKVLVK